MFVAILAETEPNVVGISQIIREALPNAESQKNIPKKLDKNYD